MADKIQAVLDSNNQASTAGWITVYNANVSGEFIGDSEEYLMFGVGIPASSYIDAPPAAQPGYAVCRVGTVWQQVEDHRGATAYNVTTRAPLVVQSLGALDDSLTLIAPGTAYDQWNGTAWVTDIVAQKNAEINEAIVKQAALISSANAKTQLWQTQLMLGIITVTDKATLTTWMTYVQAVQAIDTTTAPDITWPVAPDIL